MTTAIGADQASADGLLGKKRRVAAVFFPSSDFYWMSHWMCRLL